MKSRIWIELSDALYLYQILATEKVLPQGMDSKFATLIPNSRAEQFLKYIEDVFEETGETPRQVDMKNHFDLSQGRVQQILAKL